MRIEVSLSAISVITSNTRRTDRHVFFVRQWSQPKRIIYLTGKRNYMIIERSGDKIFGQEVGCLRSVSSLDISAFYNNMYLNTAIVLIKKVRYLVRSLTEYLDFLTRKDDCIDDSWRIFLLSFKLNLLERFLYIYCSLFNNHIMMSTLLKLTAI